MALNADPGPETRDNRPRGASRRAAAVGANLLVYWFSRHWLLLMNLAVALFVSAPFLAPVLMHEGAIVPATILYKLYSPTCHQLAFRSWFLFGDQVYYPLSTSGIPGVHYFDEYVADREGFVGLDPVTDFGYYSWSARRFLGDEQMGYKVALCQRDVATYLAMLVGGFLFGLARRVARPLPWFLFVLLGLIPMLADGGYQLVSNILPWLRPHETTAFLRTITGVMFGLGLVWLTYPHIELGMRETARELQQKLAGAGLLPAP